MNVVMMIHPTVVIHQSGSGGRTHDTATCD